MSDLNPVVWFEIAGPKGKDLQEFYRQAFGWKINADNPMSYGLVEVSETSPGIGGGISQCPQGKSGVTVCIGVADLDASLRKVEGLGAKIFHPATEMPGFGIKVAYVQDPQGNVIGLVQDMKRS